MFLGWYDDTKKSIAEKIEEAVERFVTKFGEQPNVCLVNPANVAEVEGLEVKPMPYVRPNHFWIGREETPAQVPAAA